MLVDVAGGTRWVHVFEDVALRVVWRPRHLEPIIAHDWLDVVGVPAFAGLAAAISAAPAEFLAQRLALDFGEPHAGPFAASMAARGVSCSSTWTQVDPSRYAHSSQ